MYFSWVLLVLAMTFISVQCDPIRFKRNDSYTEVVNRPCTIEHLAEFADVMKNATCKPRYTLIALKPMIEQDINPSVVSVRRCGGRDTAYSVCAPKDTEIIEVPVSINNNDTEKCHVVKIVEHTSCKDTCRIKPEDCNAEQEYDAPSCQCQCKGGKELEKNCNDQQKWNSNVCECRCKAEDTRCTSGYTWDSKHCKCKI